MRPNCSNDKALANNNNPEQRNRAPASGTTYIIGSGQDDDSGRTQVTFKGKLSIGVDSLSNTLIVSTEGEHLMRNVSEMIETLDQAAQSSATVSVVQVPAGTSSQNVAKSLAEILGQPQAAQPRNGEQQDRRAAQQQQRRVTQEADQAGRRREQPE